MFGQLLPADCFYSRRMTIHQVNHSVVPRGPRCEKKLMAGKDEEVRLFHCCCESGENYSQLEIWDS